MCVCLLVTTVSPAKWMNRSASAVRVEVSNDGDAVGLTSVLDRGQGPDLQNIFLLLLVFHHPLFLSFHT